MAKNIFTQCTACNRCWLNQTDFLSDPAISIVGLQVSFEDLVEGLVMFNHTCGTTFSVEVSMFKSLYDGTVFSERMTGSEECQGYCLNREELRPCPAKCECAYVREIVQKIKEWPKYN